jgi:hypothetical protein
MSNYIGPYLVECNSFEEAKEIIPRIIVECKDYLASKDYINYLCRNGKVPSLEDLADLFDVYGHDAKNYEIIPRACLKPDCSASGKLDIRWYDKHLKSFGGPCIRIIIINQRPDYEGYEMAPETMRQMYEKIGMLLESNDIPYETLTG